MNDNSPKTRIITVRVSDREYENLRVATLAKGYRSVSELARASMRTMVGEQLAPHQALARRVDEQAQRIAAITKELERLIARRAAGIAD